MHLKFFASTMPQRKVPSSRYHCPVYPQNSANGDADSCYNQPKTSSLETMVAGGNLGVTLYREYCITEKAKVTQQGLLVIDLASPFPPSDVMSRNGIWNPDNVE